MQDTDFVILYVIVMICFGITSTVFYPEQYGFGQDDYIVEAEEYYDDRDPTLIDQILGVFGGIAQAIVGMGQFLWACLSFNIPYVPDIVRICITVPFHAGMLFVIIRTIFG